MSSTIDRRDRASGQIVVLFAGGIAVLLLIAALVFDVGQSIFQQKAQQDASDAAALAGARWLVDDSTNCKSIPSNANCPKSVQAAMDIAEKHGYDASQISVHIPPVAPSKFAGAKGYVQVSIQGRHQSWFAGLIGLTQFNIGTMAVAANTKGYSLPYSFLALNPACSSGGGGASSVSGNGTVSVGGAIQVNTTGCGSAGALQINGSGTNPLAVTAAGGCSLSDSSPGYKLNGSATSVNCPGLPSTGQSVVPDPLSDLSISLSAVASTPTAPVQVVTGSLGNNSGCPGGTQAGTQAVPKSCQLQMSGNATTLTVVLSPGVYWGGINVQYPGTGKTMNIYLLPGIYAMAGGGFSATGSGSGIVNLWTVPSATNLVYGGGVLIYNTDDNPACLNGVTGACIGAIKLTGSSNPQSTLQLKPYQYDPYQNLLIYQDRNASSQPDITLTGQAAFTLEGTIYAPNAEVKIDGQGSGVSSQIIASNFSVNGSGTLSVTYNADGVYKLTGVGLVE